MSQQYIQALLLSVKSDIDTLLNEKDMHRSSYLFSFIKRNIDRAEAMYMEIVSREVN